MSKATTAARGATPSAQPGAAKAAQVPEVPSRQRSAAALQGAVGNRALFAALGAAAGAPKLTVSDPGGPAESFAHATVARAFGPGALSMHEGRSPRPRAVSPALAELIAGARGRGTALPPGLRSTMEEKLGGQHAAVRVHVDETAARAAASLGARAFTSGKDVFFAAGAWQPELPAGRAVLAHELVHTMRDAGATGTVFRLTAPQETRLRQELSKTSARHRAVVIVAIGDSSSDPLETTGSGKTQLEALQASFAKLPKVFVTAATGKRATLSFAVSDVVAEDSATWLESLAAARGWNVEAFAPRVGSLRGWPALEAAANGADQPLTLAVDKSYPAPAAASGGSAKAPAAAKQAAAPAAAPPSGAAAVGHFAKTTTDFDLMSSTGKDREQVGIGAVRTGTWVRITGVEGEAYQFDSHGRIGVAHRSWLRVDATMDEAGVEAAEAAKSAEVDRKIQDWQAARLQKHPLVGRFAQTNRVQDIRASTAEKAELVDRLPKGAWVQITGVVDPEGQALEIIFPFSGRSGVTSRHWVDLKTDDEAAASGDEDVVRLLERDELHEDEEDDGPAAGGYAAPPDASVELLVAVDVDAVIESEVALYQLDEAKMRRGAELAEKDIAGSTPMWHAMPKAEREELRELNEWARTTDVEGLAKGFLAAFENATRGIGHNVIDAVARKVAAEKKKLPTTAVALHSARAMFEARKAHEEVKRSLDAEQKAPILNTSPIASEPGAAAWAKGSQARADERHKVANAGRDRLTSLSHIYSFAGREYADTQPIDWWAFGATRSLEDVRAVLDKDIAAREDSIAKARTFLDEKDSIYALDLLMARSQEIFGIEKRSVPGGVLRFAAKQVAVDKLTVSLFALAINFIPGGVWVKAARLVAGLLLAASAYDEHYKLVAAQDVGLASEEPSEVWLWLEVAGLGFDVGDLIKSLGPTWRTVVKAKASMDPAQGRAAMAALDDLRGLAAERRQLKELLKNDVEYKDALAAFRAARDGSAAAGLPFVGGAVNELAELAYFASRAKVRNFRRWLVELKAAGVMRKAAKRGGVDGLRKAWKEGNGKWLAEEQAAKTAKARPTIADRKVSALADPKATPLPAFSELDSALAKKGLAPGDQALIQGYGPAIRKLRQGRGKAADGLIDELLSGIEPGYGESAHRVFRRTLRRRMLDDILHDPNDVARSPAESRTLLDAYADLLPDSASKGALFGAWREARLGKGALEHIKPLEGMHPRAPKVSRNADGAVRVTSTQKKGPPKGNYAVEDKAGGSFNAKQAEDYASAVSGGKWPVPDTKPEESFDGLIYFFQEHKTAKKALDAMKPPANFAKVYVGYFDADGVLQWLP